MRLSQTWGKFRRNNEKVFETSTKSLVNREVFINLEYFEIIKRVLISSKEIIRKILKTLQIKFMKSLIKYTVAHKK